MTELSTITPSQTALYTINNPESVIEVFLDVVTSTVREVKCLNHNRCKEYTYTAAEYLDRYSHHPAGMAVKAALGA